MTRFPAPRIPHSLARLLLPVALAGSVAVSACGSPDAHATGLPSTLPPHNRCTAGPTIQATWIRSGVLSVSGRCFTPGGAVVAEGFQGLYLQMFDWSFAATRGRRLCVRAMCYSTGGTFSHKDAVNDSYPMAVMAIDVNTYRRSNIVYLNPCLRTSCS
jgi:hypothetical protein